jgi:post-segregation antitoxin (ccd killing protein)
MAKKQTRRSISVSREKYDRLKAYAEANNTSMSALVELAVDKALPPAAVPTLEDANA